MSSRVILHVDMDAFFASVEQREHPEYRGKPVVVGADPREGKGRGVVAACSYEARRFGIHSALPISRAYRLCPNAVYVRPNGSLYSRVSRSIMEILRRFTDLVEPISIDEAFLDVTGSRRLWGDGKSIALAVKKAVCGEQELSCSIGLAPNKFLAKVASDLEKPDGLVEVLPGHEAEFLENLPVRCIWGVGPRTEEKLKGMGIRTIGAVAALPRGHWVERFGRHGEHLWLLSQGIDDRPVRSTGGFKSLSHEHTFSEDVEDVDEIKKTLLSLSENVARRARKNGSHGKTVTLKWRYADFSTLTRQKSLSFPTDDSQVIYRTACSLMESLGRFPQKVRLVGVALSQFVEKRREQPKLFGQSTDKKDRLNASLDEIALKFGKQSVKKASLMDRSGDDDDRFSSFLKK